MYKQNVPSALVPSPPKSLKKKKIAVLISGTGKSVYFCQQFNIKIKILLHLNSYDEILIFLVFNISKVKLLFKVKKKIFLESGKL